MANGCPIPCNKRIEALKKWLKFALDTLHDVIVDTTDESKEWYEMFWDEIETIKTNIDDEI